VYFISICSLPLSAAMPLSFTVSTFLAFHHHIIGHHPEAFVASLFKEHHPPHHEIEHFHDEFFVQELSA